jgi:hypothetical protein
LLSTSKMIPGGVGASRRSWWRCRRSRPFEMPFAYSFAASRARARANIPERSAGPVTGEQARKPQS